MAAGLVGSKAAVLVIAGAALAVSVCAVKAVHSTSLVRTLGENASESR